MRFSIQCTIRLKCFCRKNINKSEGEQIARRPSGSSGARTHVIRMRKSQRTFVAVVMTTIRTVAMEEEASERHPVPAEQPQDHPLCSIFSPPMQVKKRTVASSSGVFSRMLFNNRSVLAIRYSKTGVAYNLVRRF
ncbi:hypothetical protein PUN28_002714 [Cardiocondyla obscurior]|uniref:Uncharacterized protein n=1 Tax=Cardiocondyla obscurior TaxID=286306 RepID=A0AAW2GVS9_9HYME